MHPTWGIPASSSWHLRGEARSTGAGVAEQAGAAHPWQRGCSCPLGGLLRVWGALAWVSPLAPPLHSQAAYICLLVFDCLRFSEFD